MMHLDRKQIDRIENILIVILVCTALFLVGRTGMFQAFTGRGSDQTAAHAGDQETAFLRTAPVALLAQTEQGRWGVRYDQAALDALYRDGLDQTLSQALGAMEDPVPCAGEDWQKAVTESGEWIHLDFLYDVIFDSRKDDGEGAGRCFLLTAQKGVLREIFFYNQQTGSWYTGQVRDQMIPLPGTLDRAEATGGIFAFEAEDLPGELPPAMVLLEEPPACLRYQVTNALPGLDAEARGALLKALEFNIRAASVYESADSVVIREGADTIRLQENGTVSFHGTDGGEVRYPAASHQVTDLQQTAEKILDQAFSGIPSAGRFLCQSVETGADGTVELTYCRVLDGAAVQLWENGWSARFVFRDGGVISYDIILRAYTAGEETSAVMPERQAAAAAQAKGYGGRELQLCYRDDGTTEVISAGWTIREAS